MPIQIVDSAYLFPQRCFFTGDPTLDRPLIDTGVNDTEGGRVYISLQFMDDLAAAAGYATRAQTEQIVTENEDLKRQLSVLPAAMERAANAIRDISATAVSDLLTGIPDSPVPVLAERVEVAPRARRTAQGSAAAAVEQGRARL